MRTAISAIAMHGKKILLVEKKGILILPGGKKEKNETDILCLIREVREELPKAWLKLLGKGPIVCGERLFKGTKIKVKTFFVEITGEIYPSAEIANAKWVSIKKLKRYKLSKITRKILLKSIFKHK